MSIQLTAVRQLVNRTLLQANEDTDFYRKQTTDQLLAIETAMLQVVIHEQDEQLKVEIRTSAANAERWRTYKQNSNKSTLEQSGLALQIKKESRYKLDSMIKILACISLLLAALISIAIEFDLTSLENTLVWILLVVCIVSFIAAGGYLFACWLFPQTQNLANITQLTEIKQHIMK